jgi:hypothetical protein
MPESPGNLFRVARRVAEGVGLQHILSNRESSKMSTWKVPT